ncbi:uncharacterized protein LOC130707700 isoform X1 [Balaenoptera acutorostrata]|uniref:Uncharacterized protein LOC130707700 isoform X1 n=1 Tax=Balaenoptera acutorostrata TaxID=9767 RepID=A0ABM3TDK0_BALAC|nr:uncharacterized protein LOC130707700 isoform X1 [Balaenoptera acutorostrata]
MVTRLAEDERSDRSPWPEFLLLAVSGWSPMSCTIRQVSLGGHRFAATPRFKEELGGGLCVLSETEGLGAGGAEPQACGGHPPLFILTFPPLRPTWGARSARTVCNSTSGSCRVSPQLSSGGWSLKKLKCSKSFHCNTQGLQCVEPQDLEAGIGLGRRPLLSPGSRITTCVFEGGASAGLQAGGQGPDSAPPGRPAFASPVPSVGGGENPPALTLHRAGYTATPGLLLGLRSLRATVPED